MKSATQYKGNRCAVMWSSRMIAKMVAQVYPSVLKKRLLCSKLVMKGCYPADPREVNGKEIYAYCMAKEIS